MLNSTNPLKVAILGSRGIPAKYGGFETVVEKIGERLVKMNADVVVFCPSSSSLERHRYKGIELRFVPDFEKYLKSMGTLLYDFVSLLKASISDSSIVYMLGYGSSFFCTLPKIFGKRVIINTDGLEWKRSKWSGAVRTYLSLAEWFSTKIADVLISDSMAIKRYFLERYMKSSVYITNGADPFHSRDEWVLKEFGVKSKEYYLVVARLEPENHIHTILKGFNLSKSKKRLLLVTNLKKSRYSNEIKNLAAHDKRIIWYGPLYDRYKLNELRAGSFAYIHGHSVGGTNPSLLESMACGTFVIAFDVPFNKEVAGKSNVYFKDERELKKIIDKMENVKSKNLNEIGSENRHIITRFYNWDHIAKQHFNLFKNL